MASPKKRLDTNAPGDFFVDSTCIDCDTCRWMAPAVFDRAAGQARVHTQPAGPADTLAALQAVISCPTGSIGTTEKHDFKAVKATFPIDITPEVAHCGYHSRDSFGAASYLLRRPDGNVLIDSPRFTPPLVDRLEAAGGVALMVLTHRDDVADHAAFARHFGCPRVLHADDVTAGTRAVEHRPAGDEPVELGPGLTFIPTPGHTEGSACLLVDDRYLFTGDHLAWSRREDRLVAFRGACWYDWATQVESMTRLLGYDFEWVLPGHGARANFPVDEMRARVAGCVAWMKTV